MDTKCNCENVRCDHTICNKMCDNVPSKSNTRIKFIGLVCEECLSHYPAEFILDTI